MGTYTDMKDWLLGPIDGVIIIRQAQNSVSQALGTGPFHICAQFSLVYSLNHISTGLWRVNLINFLPSLKCGLFFSLRQGSKVMFAPDKLW